MNKITFHSLLIPAIVLCSFSLHAQNRHTIKIGNETLMALCDRLNEKNNEVIKLEEADINFTNAIAFKIDSIIKRGAERSSFLKELKKVNSSFMPKTFNGLTYLALNNRLKRENTSLTSDYAYCNLLQKILSLSKKFRENKKVYYAANKYKIPESLKPVAKEIYLPAINEIISVANLFKELPFTAVLRTTGYSDNIIISRNSDFYADMSENLQTSDLSNDEINIYLSYLRSYDVSDLLRSLMSERSKDLFEPQNLDIDFETEGKGNELPYIDKEGIPDKKRRVVYVYWHILPNF